MCPEMHLLLLKENKKVAGQGSIDRNREARRERTTEAWFPMRVTNEPAEEEEVPLKRKRSTPLDKGKQVQASSSGKPTGEGELIELPNL